MKVYEEYLDAAEKRRAQRAAKPLKRMHPTGKARGYLLVFHEDGEASAWPGRRNALGNCHATQPGGKPHSLSHAQPELLYLRDSCRAVGMDHIPAEWRKAFAIRLYDMIRDNITENYNKRYYRFLRKAKREFGLDIRIPS